VPKVHKCTSTEHVIVRIRPHSCSSSVTLEVRSKMTIADDSIQLCKEIPFQRFNQVVPEATDLTVWVDLVINSSYHVIVVVRGSYASHWLLIMIQTALRLFGVCSKASGPWTMLVCRIGTCVTTLRVSLAGPAVSSEF
jgi:hypothetical protein